MPPDTASRHMCVAGGARQASAAPESKAAGVAKRPKSFEGILLTAREMPASANQVRGKSQ